MRRRRRFHEPLLALAGILVAFAGAGAAVYATDHFRARQDALVVFLIAADTPAATPTAAAAQPTVVAPAATASPAATSAPAGLPLERASFALPADATANNGGSIGPFCCRGRTVTVRSAAGEVLGYAYWFKWQGQAYDQPRGGSYIGIFPDIQVLVQDAAAGQSAISLAASEIAPGVTRTVQVGRLAFTLRFTGAEQTSYNGATYVVEGSLAATLQVEAR